MISFYVINIKYGDLFNLLLGGVIMNNIKKSFIFFFTIFALFSFKTKIFASNVCTYSIDYPFQGVNEQLLGTQYTYLNYILDKVYSEKFGYQFPFQTYIDNVYFSDTYITKYKPYGPNIKKITLKINDGEKSELIISGKNYYGDEEDVSILASKENVFGENKLKSNGSCPDLVSMILPDSIIIDKLASFFTVFDLEYFYRENKSLDELTIDAFQSINFLEYYQLVFFSDKLKEEMGGIALVNYAYSPSFDKTSDDKNIDPIVDKYLRIDGVVEALDKINKDIDSSFNNNKISSYNLDKQTMSSIVKNITDFDIIDSELKVLKNFNSITISNYTGLHNIMNSFLSESYAGYKATEWFDKYMPNDQSRYSEALETLLTILNSEETKNEVNSKNELEDLAKNYGYCRINFNFDEEKIKENCMDSCKNYQEFKKEYDCRNSGNPSACVASYPSNFCTGKTSEEIVNDMNEKKEKIDDNIEEIMGKKLIEYYENKGIEISDDTDFCDILIGKDNENGLYPYIKIVLNVTRIGGTVLVVILTGLDVMKVISSFKDDENKKFWNHLKIRLICLVVLILVPTIINFLVKLVIESACKVEI